MMEQVLMNLVVNARDAMPQGGNLEIAIASVELDAAHAARMPGARAGEFAVLAVKDNGQGIPPEVLPRIFDPFFTTKDIGKGTGLGLATVYGILQQHDGWIQVESQTGKGTTFRIYLPLLADAPADEAAAAPAPVLPGGSETILVVEDEPAVRRLATRALARLGYRIIEAGNGRQALELWEQHRAAIRLMLTDLVMPEGISGLELSRRLRAQAPGLPVIFMSGYNAETTGLGSDLEEGVNFLAKPFNQAQLAAIIRTGLDRK
jgi:CheY-like chemotaxis protein